MAGWFSRKARDIRHAVQEFRTGDDIDRERSTVRTTIVGGRPPGDDARVPVPMGIERILRKAAADPRFERELLADREATLAASGLELTLAECAILRVTPAEQLSAMVEQIRPTLTPRRGFLKRVAAAAGMALFGAGIATTQVSCGTKGERSDMPERTLGERIDMPDPKPAGSRPDDASKATMGLSAREYESVPKTRGISPDMVEPKEEEAEAEGE